MEQRETEVAFNPAVLYVQSIAGLLDILDVQMLTENYLKAQKILERLFNRIEHKLKPEESAELLKDFENAQLKLVEKDISHSKRIQNYYQGLSKIERKLKRSMKKYGFLIPSKEDPRFAVLKR